MLTLLGIVAPSLLLVLAVRRWIAAVPWKIAALFLALTLGFLHGAVFTSNLPVPVDEVARGYPWRGLFGDVQAKNPLTNDTVKQFLPWMQAAREELMQFHAPLWNRYSFSGYPLLGNGQSAPFSPLFLTTLFVPLPKQIVAMAGLKIFVALLFGYLFMKREGADDAAACFAAIAFAFSCVMTVYLYYSTASVIAFLPAMLFALLHVVDRPTTGSVVLVALVMATLMANGHPESVLHIAIACVCLLAIELALARDRREFLRRFRLMLLGVAAGLAISAPAWLPVAELVPLSARYATLRQSAPQTLPLTAAWALVTPNGFGNPLRHNWSWISNYSIVATSYAGLLVLALAIAAVAMRGATRERARLAVAVILFLAAMDWSVAGRALNALPLLGITANDKLRFVSIFLAATVAAGAIRERKWKVAAAGLPLVALVAYVYYARIAVMRPVDLAGAAAVILYLLLPRKWAVVLCAAELFLFNAGFNALVDTTGRGCRSSRHSAPTRRASRSALPGSTGRSCRTPRRDTDCRTSAEVIRWNLPRTRSGSGASPCRSLERTSSGSSIRTRPSSIISAFAISLLRRMLSSAGNGTSSIAERTGRSSRMLPHSRSFEALMRSSKSGRDGIDCGCTAGESSRVSQPRRGGGCARAGVMSPRRDLFSRSTCRRARARCRSSTGRGASRSGSFWPLWEGSCWRSSGRGIAPEGMPLCRVPTRKSFLRNELVTRACTTNCAWNRRGGRTVVERPCSNGIFDDGGGIAVGVR